MDALTFDLKGKVCPSTLLQTLKYVNTHKKPLKNKDIELIILTDHRDALNTIPDALEKMGFSFKIEKNTYYYKIHIYKD
jgi:TusA-related sulfurtransferase